jgi:hypothetical protein
MTKTDNSCQPETRSQMPFHGVGNAPRVSAGVGTLRKSCHFVPTSDPVFEQANLGTSRQFSGYNNAAAAHRLAQCANLMAIGASEARRSAPVPLSASN